MEIFKHKSLSLSLGFSLFVRSVILFGMYRYVSSRCSTDIYIYKSYYFFFFHHTFGDKNPLTLEKPCDGHVLTRSMNYQIDNPAFTSLTSALHIDISITRLCLLSLISSNLGKPPRVPYLERLLWYIGTEKCADPSKVKCIYMYVCILILYVTYLRRTHTHSRTQIDRFFLFSFIPIHYVFFPVIL